MSTTTCTACGRTADRPVIQGVLAGMPAGWADLTIAVRGAPLSNHRLCDSCARTVARAIDPDEYVSRR